jgi:carbamoyl-phosphate synthase large subunit
MNPRVSRSSALASKATGFAIAKIATKLSLGYTLDEIPNDITQKTPASFEPTLDYVVVKVPRFAFEKFPAADNTLTTTMKSVGEAMAMGRNFTEALQKALRSLEQKGSQLDFSSVPEYEVAELIEKAKRPTTDRLHQVQRALLGGATVKRSSKQQRSILGSLTSCSSSTKPRRRSARQACSLRKCCATPSAMDSPMSRSVP